LLPPPAGSLAAAAPWLARRASRAEAAAELMAKPSVPFRRRQPPQQRLKLLEFDALN
jgi:hypothetical protein